MARTKTARGARMRRSITAYPEEYVMIERFIHAVREYPDIASDYLRSMEGEIKEAKIKAYADSLEEE